MSFPFGEKKSPGYEKVTDRSEYFNSKDEGFNFISLAEPLSQFYLTSPVTSKTLLQSMDPQEPNGIAGGDRTWALHVLSQARLDVATTADDGG